jgi:hypothetical protein
VVHRIEHGLRAGPDDLDLLEQRSTTNIAGRTICALGDAASMPVQELRQALPVSEFEYHIEHKKCLVPARRAARRQSNLRGATQHARDRNRRQAGPGATDGSTVIEAASGLPASYIPHFCYHKKLSIAASCRMCLVQVEKRAQAAARLRDAGH